MFVIPRTKHMASKILDLPLPFSPVIELKLSSLCFDHCYSQHSRLVSQGGKKKIKKKRSRYYHPEMTVRTAYDLKPCASFSAFIFEVCTILEGSTYVYDNFCNSHFSIEDFRAPRNWIVLLAFSEGYESTYNTIIGVDAKVNAVKKNSI